MDQATGETPLPEGILTLLMTDVEGSTRLWEQRPTEAAALLRDLEELARSEVRRCGGTVIPSRSEGDSLFAVFGRAGGAVQAASDIQRALHQRDFPLRVRIGIHSGECGPVEGGYYGPVVNRCARVRSLAHGGQTLLSRSTYVLTRDSLPVDVHLRDLGEHRLRDLQRAEHVFQLVHPDLPHHFPAPRSLSACPNNLPLQVTSFVGRAAEMEDVKALLETHRLLTLTGSGGTGKTRLALQAAADVLDRFPEGVWLVELAALREPSLVAQEVAEVLGVREEPGRPVIRSIAEFLAEKSCLVLLDNCEHLLDACAQLAFQVLQLCPEVRIIATSRQALGLPGETTYRVPSLATGPAPEAAGLSVSEAMQLFADRARAANPAFHLTPANARAVDQVCARLDGIPLAIELAAARTRVLPVESIAARLDDRFRLLSGGSRTSLPRQQTLRALFDWSYDLLRPNEQRLLRALAVFRGGWSLAAAEAVCGEPGGEGEEVLDLLASLVDKSLVLLHEAERVGGRYRLLESLRIYGLDRLAEQSELADYRSRHAGYYLAFAEEVEQERRDGSTTWLERLDADAENLREALEWFEQEGRAADGLRLALALHRWWEVRGHFSESQRFLAALIEQAGDSEPELRGKALRLWGWLACRQGGYQEALELARKSLTLSRATGDPEEIAISLNLLATVAAQQGDFELSRTSSEEALQLWEALQHGPGVTGTLQTLGALALKQGDLDTAERLFNQVMTRRAGESDISYMAASQLDLGHLYRMRGDYDRARQQYQQALTFGRQLVDRTVMGWALAELGRVAMLERRHGDALQLFRESLGIWRHLANREGMTRTFEGMAGCFAALGQAERAVKLYAASESLREILCFGLAPSDRADYAPLLEIRKTVPRAEHDRWWREGRSMPLERVLDLAGAAADPVETPTEEAG